MMNKLDELLIRLEKRYKRMETLYETKLSHYNATDHNFHGGRTVGYYEGKLTMLEDIIDTLEDLKVNE